jgi:hypothetical protein
MRCLPAFTDESAAFSAFGEPLSSVPPVDHGHKSATPFDYMAIMISEQLATNMTMEVNAAISRIMSVIWLSCAFMFLLCSIYVPLSTWFHTVSLSYG